MQARWIRWLGQFNVLKRRGRRLARRWLTNVFERDVPQGPTPQWPTLGRTNVAGPFAWLGHSTALSIRPYACGSESSCLYAGVMPALWRWNWHRSRGDRVSSDLIRTPVQPSVSRTGADVWPPTVKCCGWVGGGCWPQPHSCAAPMAAPTHQRQFAAEHLAHDGKISACRSF